MMRKAIETILTMESNHRERKIAAEAEAKKIVSDARQEGLAQLEAIQKEAAENREALLLEAEQRAEQRIEEMEQSAKQQRDALRDTANSHLEEAVRWIVERIGDT